jgi:hypothetical protein
MELEVGKKYVDGYGDIVTITEDNPDTYGYRFKGVHPGGSWNKYTISGKDMIERPGKGDLVNEYMNMNLWSSIAPTTEPKTWGAMTDVEKGGLLLANLRGARIEFKPSGRYWTLRRPDSNVWHNDWCYRVKVVVSNQVAKPTLDGKTVTIDGCEYILTFSR